MNQAVTEYAARFAGIPMGMLRVVFFAAFSLAGVAVSPSLHAGVTADSLAPPHTDSTMVKAGDSTRISGTAVKKEPKKFQPTKTPMLAVELSAILPGAGQVYDEKYWKVPLIWGFGGYWVSVWISDNKQYHDYQQQYLQSLVQYPGQGNGQFMSLRDFYRDERDKFAWYIGVLYFANILDAYVSAHLYDFDVSPDLGSRMNGIPPNSPGTNALQFAGPPRQVGLTLRWTLGR